MYPFIETNMEEMDRDQQNQYNPNMFLREFRLRYFTSIAYLKHGNELHYQEVLREWYEHAARLTEWRVDPWSR